MPLIVRDETDESDAFDHSILKSVIVWFKRQKSLHSSITTAILTEEAATGFRIFLQSPQKLTIELRVEEDELVITDWASLMLDNPDSHLKIADPDFFKNLRASLQNGIRSMHLNKLMQESGKNAPE